MRGGWVFRAHCVEVAGNLELCETRSLPEITAMESEREGRCNAGEGGCHCSHHGEPGKELTI